MNMLRENRFHQIKELVPAATLEFLLQLKESLPQDNKHYQPKKYVKKA